MFLGLGQGQDRDQNIGTCWKLLNMGFKMIFILEMGLSLLSIFLSFIVAYLSNITILTIYKFQIWRPATAILVPSLMGDFFGILMVLFDCYILYMFAPAMEKKSSTAFFLVQIFMQSLLCNLVLTVVAFPLIWLQLASPLSLIGYGLRPIIFIFLWKSVSEDPERPSRFCCFPCLIPYKYIPVLFLLIFVLFGFQFVPMVIYCALGYYQSMVLKKSIFRMPMKLFRKVENIMPASIREDPGFTKISAVENYLREQCNDGCCDWGLGRQEEAANPYAQGQPNPGRSFIDVMGGGVPIGGSSSNHNYVQNHPRNGENHGNPYAGNVGQRQRGPKLNSDDPISDADRQNKNEKKDEEEYDGDGVSMVSEKPLKGDTN